MRLTRKRAPAPGALSLGQAPRNQKQAASAPSLDHARALDTLEATMLGINAIEQALSEARELVAEAAHTEAPGKRALLAERISFLRQQIDDLAQTNTAPLKLINGGRDTLELALDADGRERLLVAHFNLTAGRGGLGLSQVKGKFAQTPEIERASKELDAARVRLQAVSEVLRKSAMRIADQLEHAAPTAPAQSTEGKGESAAAKASHRVKRKPISP
jgi:hypothetical protein